MLAGQPVLRVAQLSQLCGQARHDELHGLLVSVVVNREGRGSGWKLDQ